MEKEPVKYFQSVCYCVKRYMICYPFVAKQISCSIASYQKFIFTVVLMQIINVTIYVNSEIGQIRDIKAHISTSISCYDDVIKWKHFPHYWPFVRGIHQSPVNCLHNGQ